MVVLGKRRHVPFARSIFRAILCYTRREKYGQILCLVDMDCAAFMTTFLMGMFIASSPVCPRLTGIETFLSSSSFITYHIIYRDTKLFFLFDAIDTVICSFYRRRYASAFAFCTPECCCICFVHAFTFTSLFFSPSCSLATSSIPCTTTLLTYTNYICDTSTPRTFKLVETRSVPHQADERNPYVDAGRAIRNPFGRRKCCGMTQAALWFDITALGSFSTEATAIRNRTLIDQSL